MGILKGGDNVKITKYHMLGFIIARFPDSI